MNKSEIISQLKEKAIALKGSIESKIKEVKNDSRVNDAFRVVSDKMNDIKSSTVYENGLQIVDAYKDARDSFKKMDAYDYYDYMTSGYSSDNDVIEINNNEIKLMSEHFVRKNRYSSIEELKMYINDYLRLISSFSKVKIFKVIIDPIDNKEKAFKIGELHSDLKNDYFDLAIICHDEYSSRIIRNIIESYGYKYIENKNEGIIKKLINNIK